MTTTPTESEAELRAKVWTLEKRNRLYLEHGNGTIRDRAEAGVIPTTKSIRAWLDEVDQHVPDAVITVHSGGPYRGRYLEASPKPGRMRAAT